jgi:abequosyltransferase
VHKKLSICIPIYNCADFVGHALNSILPQATQEVEVVVYDGGSTDDTPNLMEWYVKNHVNFRYYRGTHRGGIDSDMAICADLAEGDYIWLFSGDDVMRPGAINQVLLRTSTDYDVYIGAHTICDINMRFLRICPVLLPDQNFCAEFSDPTSRLEWFRRANTTEAFFSFMSTIIVRREKWQSGKLPADFKTSCWGHVARLFEIAPSGLYVCYLADILLDQRGDNDSFSANGVVNRYKIAIAGYQKIANEFFGGSSIEAFNIRRVIRNEFNLRMFLGAKHRCKKNPLRENINTLNELIVSTYCDSPIFDRLFWLIYRLPIWNLETPSIIYRFVRNLQDSTIRKLR